MRDVIVVGAGGGGAVVAKELAQRGLDVLLLEGGARFADIDREWSHFESDANNPSSGYFRFGPADRSKAPWVQGYRQQHAPGTAGRGRRNDEPLPGQFTTRHTRRIRRLRRF